jgi:hypothetical protein
VYVAAGGEMSPHNLGKGFEPGSIFNRFTPTVLPG